MSWRNDEQEFKDIRAIRLIKILHPAPGTHLPDAISPRAFFNTPFFMYLAFGNNIIRRGWLPAGKRRVRAVMSRPAGAQLSTCRVLLMTITPTERGAVGERSPGCSPSGSSARARERGCRPGALSQQRLNGKGVGLHAQKRVYFLSPLHLKFSKQASSSDFLRSSSRPLEKVSLFTLLPDSRKIWS